jgi:hypothetical protein
MSETYEDQQRSATAASTAAKIEASRAEGQARLDAEAEQRAADELRQRVDQRAHELKLAAEAAQWQAFLDQAEAEILAESS